MLEGHLEIFSINWEIKEIKKKFLRPSSGHFRNYNVVQEYAKNVISYVVWDMRWSQKHEKSTKINPSWKNHTIFQENTSISMSSKILVKMPAVLREIEKKTLKKKLPMCPTAHVPYCPCALPPRYPISVCNINHPFTHVPHCPCATLLMCQKDVNLSKGCQIVKKMSNVKKSNT